MALTLTQGLSFDDVLLVPRYNGIRSRQDVATDVDLGSIKFRIPIISSNMDTVTGPTLANKLIELGGLPILHRFLSIEDAVADFKKIKDPSRCGVSLGIGDAAFERAEALVDAGARILCVDVAHGHSKGVNQMIRRLREKWKSNVYVIAGNVATYAGADYLAAAQADAIKVGIGPGSACTTRMKTGFGFPQLSAIAACSKVDRLIIADGGIRNSGDAVKAIAAGAHFVMLGGLFAGTIEAPGPTAERKLADGTVQKVKRYRGMASREAQEEFMGLMAEWKTAEGVSMDIPIHGSVSDVVQDIMGGIRSALTYGGVSSLKELPRKAEFVQITQSGFIEGTPHGISRSVQS